MATKAPKKEPKRPRLQVTPSPEVWRLINVVHERTGQAKAAIAAELLDQVQPAIEMIVQALEMAAQAPREAQRLMTNFGAEAVQQLMQQQLELEQKITQHEMTLKAGDGRTVKGKREKAKRGGRGRTP